ncbi:MAG: ABC transporter ATP-binding protein [Saprospiraceae bacterium]|nr:ABC transporter ATP-binding protein [Saprospiraceae bacterium]
MISYLLTAIFTVVSIPVIIPLFEMLFQKDICIENKPAHLHSISDSIQNIKYQFSYWISGTDRKNAISIVCIIVILVFFLKNIFRYSGIYFITPVKAGILRETRDKLFQKFLRLPLSYFSEERKGDLISRMTSDVSEVETTLLSTMESLVKDPLIIFGSIGFMLYTSTKLTLFVLVLLFVTAFIIGGISRSLRRKAFQAQSEFGELVSIQEETLGGIRVIKAFGSEPYIRNRFSEILDKYKNLIININRRRELAPPLSEFLGIVVVAILLWYGASLVFADQIKGASFLAFLYAFFNVIEPSKTLSATYFNIQKGMAALERIESVMQVPETIQDHPNAVHKTIIEDKIEFKNVGFTYFNNATRVLNQISFEVPKGKTIALVGSSGSGKTTLVDLLARFYDVSSGSIEIDGINIQKIQLVDLRKMIGIVTQEAILFNDTIRNNVLCGMPNEGDEKIWEALRLAYAEDFVRESSGQLDHQIGDRGVKLSGGQRQRLTIARALYRNPPIIILDEATSALDSASEKIVQQAMNKVLENRTAIVIAHRLSTIKNADHIIVLKEGEIVERGKHDELIENQKEYYNFVQLQTFES